MLKQMLTRVAKWVLNSNRRPTPLCPQRNGKPGDAGAAVGGERVSGRTLPLADSSQEAGAGMEADGAAKIIFMLETARRQW